MSATSLHKRGVPRHGTPYMHYTSLFREAIHHIFAMVTRLVEIYRAHDSGAIPVLLDVLQRFNTCSTR
jgi:hypothetical protein